MKAKNEGIFLFLNIGMMDIKWHFVTRLYHQTLFWVIMLWYWGHDNKKTHGGQQWSVFDLILASILCIYPLKYIFV